LHLRLRAVRMHRNGGLRNRGRALPLGRAQSLFGLRDLMPTYQRCEKSVTSMAEEILSEFKTHQPLVDAGVEIDFVFAQPELDEAGEPKEDAVRHHGHKALGLCKKIPAKQRALGRGDAEITLDRHWWAHTASEEMQRALLDHELHHIEVRMAGDKIVRDYLKRPVLTLRKHDWEFGWFDIIAKRHGAASQEFMQAQVLAQSSGQLYWPQLANAPKQPVNVSH
jgi:hypothetical protein